MEALCCCTRAVGAFLHGKLYAAPPFTEAEFAESRGIFDPDVEDPERPDKRAVLGSFTITTLNDVRINHDGQTLYVTIRKVKTLFEGDEVCRMGFVGGAKRSLDLLNGQVYSLLHAIHYGNITRAVELTVVSQYDFRREDGTPWTPPSFASIGEACRKAMMTQGKMEIVECQSGGADYVQNAPAAELPEVLILDRALPSVLKAARGTLGCCTRRVLMCLAGKSGWDGDPESHLLSIRASLVGREVVVISTPDDHYFSGENGFAPEFFVAMNAAGVRVTHLPVKGCTVDLHPAAWHGVAHSKMWTRTGVEGEHFSLKPLENPDQAIVRRYVNRQGFGEAKSA